MDYNRNIKYEESNLSSQDAVVLETDSPKKIKKEKKQHNATTINGDVHQSSVDDAEVKHEKSNLSSQDDDVILSSQIDISKSTLKKKKRHSKTIESDEINESSWGVLKGENYNESKVSSRDNTLHEISEFEDISKKIKKRKRKGKNYDQAKNDEEIEHLYRNEEGKHSDDLDLSSECPRLALSETSDDISHSERKRKKKKKVDSLSDKRIHGVTSNVEDDSQRKHSDDLDLSSECPRLALSETSDDISHSERKRKKKKKVDSLSDKRIHGVTSNVEDDSQRKHSDDLDLSSECPRLALSETSDDISHSERKRKKKKKVDSLSDKRIHGVTSNIEDDSQRKHSDDLDLSSECPRLALSETSDDISHSERKRKKKKKVDSLSDKRIHGVTSNIEDDSQRKHSDDLDLSSECPRLALSETSDDISHSERKRKKKKKVDSLSDKRIHGVTSNIEDDSQRKHSDDLDLSSECPRLALSETSDDISHSERKRKKKKKVDSLSDKRIHGVTSNIEDDSQRKHSDDLDLSSECPRLALSETSDDTSRSERKRKKKKKVDSLSDKRIHGVTSNVEDDSQRKPSYDLGLSSECPRLALSETSDDISHSERKRKKKKKVDSLSDKRIHGVTSNVEDDSQRKHSDDLDLSSECPRLALSETSDDISHSERKRKKKKKVDSLSDKRIHGVTSNVEDDSQRKHSDDLDLSSECPRLALSETSDDISHSERKRKKKKKVDSLSDKRIHGVTSNVEDDSQRKHSHDLDLSFECPRLALSETSDVISRSERKRKKKKKVDSHSDKRIHGVTSNVEDDSQRKHSDDLDLSSECLRLALSETSDDISHSERKRKKKKKVDSLSDKRIHGVTSNVEDDSQRKPSYDLGLSSECPRLALSETSDDISHSERKRKKKKKVDSLSDKRIHGVTSNVEDDSQRKHSHDLDLSFECPRLALSETSDVISRSERKRKKKKKVDSHSDKRIHGVTSNVEDDSQRKHSDDLDLSSECLRLALSETSDDISHSERKRKKKKKVDSLSDKRIHGVTSNVEDDSQRKPSYDLGLSSECPRLALSETSDDISHSERKRKKKKKVDSLSDKRIHGVTSNVEDDSQRKHSDDLDLSSECPRLTLSETSDDTSRSERKREKKKKVDSLSDKRIHGVTSNVEDDSQRKPSYDLGLSSECPRLALSETNDDFSHSERKRKKKKKVDSLSDKGIHGVTSNVEGNRPSDRNLSTECPVMVLSDNPDKIFQSEKKKKKRKKVVDIQSHEDIHNVTCNGEDEIQGKHSSDLDLSSECHPLVLSKGTEEISQSEKKKKKRKEVVDIQSDEDILSNEEILNVTSDDACDAENILGKYLFNEEFNKEEYAAVLESVEKANVPESIINKLNSLVIDVNWEVHPLHQIETTICRTPTTSQELKIKNLGVNINTGKYNLREDKIIRKNWNQFCKEYGFSDHVPFMRPREFLKNRTTRINFVRYLGRGLPNRYLRSILKRFQFLLANYNTGRLSDAERSVLEAHLKLYGNKYSGIKYVFNRKKTQLIASTESISSPYKAKAFKEMKQKNELLQAVLHTSNSKDFKDLKGKIIDWNKVSEVLKCPQMSCKTAWQRFVTPSLCIKQPLYRADIKCKILESLMKINPDCYEKVDWSEVSKDVYNLPPAFLWYIYAMMCHNNKRKYRGIHWKDSIDKLREYYVKIEPSRYSGKKLPAYEIIDGELSCADS